MSETREIKECEISPMYARKTAAPRSFDVLALDQPTTAQAESDSAAGAANEGAEPDEAEEENGAVVAAAAAAAAAADASGYFVSFA